VVNAIDTTAGTGVSQIYPNVFINNTGLTPTGDSTISPVTVMLNAVSAGTGQPLGNSISITVEAGQTATVD